MMTTTITTNEIREIATMIINELDGIHMIECEAEYRNETVEEYIYEILEPDYEDREDFEELVHSIVEYIYNDWFEQITNNNTIPYNYYFEEEDF